jgi:hypothetical protein
MRLIIIIFSFLIFLNINFAQTTGTLTISTSTSQVGGKYKPKNIVAIWIQDNTGKFVKTLLAYAEKEKKYLTSWKAVTTIAGSSYNTVDAITGATRSSHGVRSCTWNCKNYLNSLMADGTYTIKMEITDQDGTGRSATFEFTKGPDAQTLTPTNVPSFSDINIVWQPLISGTSEEFSDNITINPNPVSEKAIISGVKVNSFELYDLKGNKLAKHNGNSIDMSFLKSGIYFVKIDSKSGVFVKKIIKL